MTEEKEDGFLAEKMQSNSRFRTTSAASSFSLMNAIDRGSVVATGERIVDRLRVLIIEKIDDRRTDELVDSSVLSREDVDWKVVLRELLDTVTPPHINLLDTIKKNIFNELMKRNRISMSTLWLLSFEQWKHECSRAAFLEYMMKWMEADNVNETAFAEDSIRSIFSFHRKLDAAAIRTYVRLLNQQVLESREYERIVHLLDEIWDRSEDGRRIVLCSLGILIWEKGLMSKVFEIIKKMQNASSVLSMISSRKCPPNPLTLMMIEKCGIDEYESWLTDPDELFVTILDIMFEEKLELNRVASYLARNSEKLISSERVPDEYIVRFQAWTCKTLSKFREQFETDATQLLEAESDMKTRLDSISERGNLPNLIIESIACMKERAYSPRLSNSKLARVLVFLYTEKCLDAQNVNEIRECVGDFVDESNNVSQTVVNSSQFEFIRALMKHCNDELINILGLGLAKLVANSFFANHLDQSVRNILAPYVEENGTATSHNNIAQKQEGPQALMDDQRYRRVPPELEGQVSFVFNNLNQVNLIHHVQYIRSTFSGTEPSSASFIRPELWQWLAHYIVLKRVPNEPNHHQLYMVFIDLMGESSLNEYVSSETYTLVRTLLRTTTFRDTERSSLRHLGRWMGLFFLGRNRPILSDQVDIKSLIVEACSKGSHYVEYVIPFITSIFDSHYTPKCLPEPQFFAPPNPWTVGILGVLADVFDDPGLPTPTRYDIEILFKHMELDIHTFSRANVLYDSEQRNRLCTLEAQMAATNPDQTIPTESPEDPPVYSFTDFSLLPDETMFSKAPLSVPSELTETCTSVFMSTIIAHLPALVDYCQRTSAPMVDSVLTHDFAFETDPGIIRRAAHNFLANTVAGLVVARLKDQIHQSLTTALNQKLTGKSELVPSIVNSNLPLTFAHLARFAIHRCMQDLEKRLQPTYNHMRKRMDNAETWTMKELSTHFTHRNLLHLHALKRHMYDELGRSIFGFRRHSYASAIDAALASVSQRLAMEVAGNDFLLEPIKKIVDDSDDGIRELTQRLTQLLLQSRENDEQVENLFKLVNELTLSGGSQFTANCATNYLVRTVTEPPVDMQVLRVLIRARVLVPQTLDSHYDRALDSMDNNLKPPTLLLNHIHELIHHCLIEKAPAFSVNDFAFCIQRFHEHSVLNLPYRIQTKELSDLLKINYDHLDRNPYSKFHSTALLTLANFMAGRAMCGHAATPPSFVEEDNSNSFANRTISLFKDWLNICRYDGLGRSISATNTPNMPYNNNERILWRKKNPAPRTLRQSFSFAQIRSFSYYNRQVTQFVQKLNSNGVFRSDDAIARFFKICIDVCIDLSYEEAAETPQPPSEQGPFHDSPRLNAEVSSRQRVFDVCDGFVRLVATLLRTGTDTRNIHARISLVAKVVGIVVGECEHDYERNPSTFLSIAYQRILFTLLRDILGSTLTDSISEHHITFATIHAYMNALYHLNPLKIPVFACAYLELVGNGCLMNAVFNPPHASPRLAQSYTVLLVAIVRFLEKLIVIDASTHQHHRPGNIITQSLSNFNDPTHFELVQSIFTAALRIFLVILHDFPEFTCEYSYELLEAIPIQFIQLRNLVLSAYSRQIRLPDPCIDPAKLDLIAFQQPRGPAATAYTRDLRPITLKTLVEQWFEKKEEEEEGVAEDDNQLFLNIKRFLLFDQSQYNLKVMNAVVHHVAFCAITDLVLKKRINRTEAKRQQSTPAESVLHTVTNSCYADFIVRLADVLEDHGKYLLSTCIVNQLTYPNGFTQFYSMVVVHLFRSGLTESSPSSISEILTRALAERLIVSRPHPWGLMMTFVELIKNPVHRLWQASFIRWLPEIENIFQKLSRSAYQQTNKPTTASSSTTTTTTTTTTDIE